MPAADIFRAILVALVWGMGFVVAKGGTEDFPPILMQVLRFIVTSAALFWALRNPRGNWGWLMLTTVVGGTIQYALTFTGLAGLGAGLAALVVQTEVPFLVLLGALLLGERPGPRKWAGIGIAFCGVALIGGLGRMEGSLSAILLVLGGAFTWALGQVVIRKIKGLDGRAITAWIAVLAVPQLLIASALFETGQVAALQAAGWQVWATALYLGLVMQAFGYWLWNSLLLRNEVGRVAPYLLLLPVFSVLGGIVFLGEALDTGRMIGGAVVLAGVALITLERLRPKVSPLTPPLSPP
ncbi:MAG: permease [Rhodobacteraceae bacterium GWF1_65_7]|nr:MAG: permease [Rhodobacteraceae bacterium GWF1_65_7]